MSITEASKWIKPTAYSRKKVDNFLNKKWTIFFTIRLICELIYTRVYTVSSHFGIQNAKQNNYLK